MSNEEILQKAIEKAQKNIGNKIPKDAVYDCTIDMRLSFETIFSHQFAKDFWGEENEWMMYMDGEAIDTVKEVPVSYPPWQHYEPINGWQYHLQKMVISEDPIKYLENYL